jgi:nicotinamide riboside transporter PnuC
MCCTSEIAAVAWWARKHPNRSKEYPEQVRMPKVLLIFGWLCVCVGFLMGLVAFTTARAPVGARIASVAILMIGFVAPLAPAFLHIDAVNGVPTWPFRPPESG